MHDLTLRKATAEDGEFAYQTKKAAFKEYVEQVWGWDEQEQRQLHERRFSTRDLFVIQASDIDVGILAVVYESDCVRLNQLFVLPEYQNRGIGRACMSRLIEDSEAQSLPIRLRVLKVNIRAMAFYQRLGFKSVSESETHVMMERRSRD